MIRAFLGLTAALAAFSGCAGPAHYVSRDPATGSGVVAIPNQTDVWPSYNYRAAIALIEKDTGPGNYIIDREGLETTGQRTFNDQQVNREQTFNRSNPFLPATKETVQNSVTTTDVTEWRISYRRKAAVPGVGGTIPGGAQMGLGAGTVQQTNYRSGTSTPGMIGGGVQPAGGIVPSAGPVNNGFSGGGAMGGNCVDGKCYPQ